MERCATVFEEIMKVVWHPSRVEKRMLAGEDIENM